jgi:hypothetical protein
MFLDTKYNEAGESLSYCSVEVWVHCLCLSSKKLGTLACVFVSMTLDIEVMPPEVNLSFLKSALTII